ncbi:Transglutaminase-like superfamily protein [Posidoniimonas corsicana]|uniref:Transglutaminase-like superfamily protein n=1 Tax=Posidoniimonas corsicana TaxID=1938618 RepID=A0A5C5VEE9_9BACT|nr:transglutaminase family protein [Posidoniimonas corsicana]TWT36337.1 Transglutaminase-like superfamily protein [Posidoniimonas corsicana]
MTPRPPAAAYLNPCKSIDSTNVDVARVAMDLRGVDTFATIDACFRFVRDEVQHSGDYRRNPVTCSASQVLLHRTGYCYAKSHLLCALLRANGVPAGLCYQRLCIDDHGPPCCLHGLNAVWLPDTGWFRLDPRGNKAGIDARFEPPAERLAFIPRLSGERDLPGVFARPLRQVVAALERHDSWDALLANLPDGEWDKYSLPND